MAEEPDPAVYALALMVRKFLATDGGALDQFCMSAEKHLFELSEDNGLLNPHSRGVLFTERDLSLLEEA